MAFGRLPGELLDTIIANVLPDGFESLALTCKKIYARCTPFIGRHNVLRSLFQKVDYYFEKEPLWFPIKSALDLIIRIAREPIVARYIQHADCAIDGYLTQARPRDLSEEGHDSEDLTRLLVESPYLKQAGLDWKQYYTEVEEDLKAARYSQHAAAFLLTLLPNVEILTLPSNWKSLEATNKLIEAVVCKAQQPYASYDRPSLSQVARFGPTKALGTTQRFELGWVTPFLALPHIRLFRGPSCVAIGDSDAGISFKAPQPVFGQALVKILLVCCCIDERGIANFLKGSHRLRTLDYSHSTKDGCPPHWDICEFVMAIEREVGTHLEELSVSIQELHGSITPGKATMRNFQRLRKLEFDLELVMCNVVHACRSHTANELSVESPTKSEANCPESFIADLIPASVPQLSLLSHGQDKHEKALDFMFHNFAAKKDSYLPALEKIYLRCPTDADDAYKDRCERLRRYVRRLRM